MVLAAIEELGRRLPSQRHDRRFRRDALEAEIGRAYLAMESIRRRHGRGIAAESQQAQALESLVRIHAEMVG